MEEKGIYVLEETRNGRTYSLSMPLGTPIGEAFDVTHEFLQKLTELAKKSAEQVKKTDPLNTANADVRSDE
jgi:hypothetical protein